MCEYCELLHANRAGRTITEKIERKMKFSTEELSENIS